MSMYQVLRGIAFPEIQRALAAIPPSIQREYNLVDVGCCKISGGAVLVLSVIGDGSCLVRVCASLKPGNSTCVACAEPFRALEGLWICYSAEMAAVWSFINLPKEEEAKTPKEGDSA